MKPEDFKALINKIVENRDNQGLITELATQVYDVYEERYNAHTSLADQVGEYDKKIEDLQKANMNLFLKVGNPVPAEKLAEPEKMEYEDLLKDFNI